MTIIEEFNQIAALAQVPPIKPRKRIEVKDGNGTPITVWRRSRATMRDVHHGTNEDGFRWTRVHVGIPQVPRYKPF